MLKKDMLKKDSKKILEKSKSLGWVLEPDAKSLMKLQGLDIPDFILTNSFEAADLFLKECDGPVVAKAVSKKILHKTEHNAVVTGIFSSDHLKIEMARWLWVLRLSLGQKMIFNSVLLLFLVLVAHLLKFIMILQSGWLPLIRAMFFP
jgi:hypothetical protein